MLILRLLLRSHCNYYNNFEHSQLPNDTYVISFFIFFLLFILMYNFTHLINVH